MYRLSYALQHLAGCRRISIHLCIWPSMAIPLDERRPQSMLGNLTGAHSSECRRIDKQTSEDRQGEECVTTDKPLLGGTVNNLHALFLSHQIRLKPITARFVLTSVPGSSFGRHR